MKSRPILVSSIAAACTLVVAAPLFAVPLFSPDPNTEGVTTDIFDLAQGAGVIAWSPQLNVVGPSDPRAAFGGTTTFVEPPHVIFQDGPGAGFMDFFDWQTAGPIDLSSFELHLQDDGNDARSALDFTLLGSQDGMNFSPLSTGVIPRGPSNGYLFNPLLISDNALTGTTTGLRAFRLQTTRTHPAATRVIELDGFGVPGVAATRFLDRRAFNATTNGISDEAAGLASGFTVSSAVGNDTVEDAFGRNTGPIEPDDFIFGDGGIPDDNIFGNGETIDFIDWHTSEPLTLDGFRIRLSGDGGAGPGENRDTEFVRFLVEGQEVDLFDNNGFDGEVLRDFAGGAITGDDFRIEFTRSTSSGGRIFEVDAIRAVPEPSVILALLGGAGVLALRRRRA